MQMKSLFLTACLASFMVAGCTPNINADNYNTENTQQVSVVQHGVVINTTQVKVSDSKNWTGTLAGGAAGAVLGSTVGQGSGSLLMGIGGAVLGGIGGNAAEKALSSQTATQYIVQLSDGSTLSVTQGGPILAVGTKVLLLEGKPARLIVDNTATAAANS